ncbi:PIN domain-containing protein [Actinomadura sp. 9N407]|uniref:PIN domain-containing protein n=1 Tax=Actinomadura sp. 9N407 TaxID=3375154 RepID=UPI0037AB95DC
MRLKSPGQIDNAIETLRRLKLECGNPFNRVDQQYRQQAAVLDWYEMAEGQLRNHFSSSDLIDQLRASQHRVSELSNVSAGVFNRVLNQERKDWEHRFQVAYEELERLKVFVDRPGHPVVPDTSAFMEGEFFTEYDWQSLALPLKGQTVRVIVPILVIEELDSLKRSNNRSQKQQARKVLKALWQLHGNEPTSPAALPQSADVTIEVLLDNGWHRRQPNNDAEIIDQAIQVNVLLGKPTLLASCDYVQMYRSAAEGLSPVQVPRADAED